DRPHGRLDVDAGYSERPVRMAKRVLHVDDEQGRSFDREGVEAHISSRSTPRTPPRPQFSRGTSCRITWRDSRRASAWVTMASVIARTSSRFCSTLRPSHSATITTGSSGLPRRGLLELRRVGDDCEGRPHGDGLADLHQVLGHDPRNGRRKLEVHLLALEQREHLPLLNTFADRHEPLVERRFFHRQTELGKLDGRGHQATLVSTRERAAAAMRAASGMTAFSSSGAYGIGVLAPQTRTIGARRNSQLSSAAIAAISAPKPPRLGAS